MPRNTRDLLLDAGEAVIERLGMTGLSVNHVVAEAGVAKGTFYVHFADRETFIEALHARFYARVDAAMNAATANVPPGRDLLWAAVGAYLDTCLEGRAVKALVMEMRGQGAETDSMNSRLQGFAEAAAPSLKAIGWREPKVAARLMVAMTSEVALMELEAGKRVPAARRSLYAFIESRG